MNVVEGLKELRGNRSDVGVWAPSCSQHVFTFDETYVNPDYGVPEDGAKQSIDFWQIQGTHHGCWMMKGGLKT